jgi:hypothetical protein
MRAEAERLQREANEYHVAAEKKLADANYALGQSEHRLRTAEATLRAVQEREQWLEQHDEARVRALVAAAEQKLTEAQELMKAYKADKHGAMISLQQINEREKAERSAAA